MTVRVLKTRYAVGDMMRGMASLRVAVVVGNGAIADKAGKGLLRRGVEWEMERNRPMMIVVEAVVFELQVELEPFGGGSRPMIYGRHRRVTNAGRSGRSRSRPGTGTVRLADVKRNGLIRFPRHCGRRIGRLTAHQQPAKHTTGSFLSENDVIVRRFTVLKPSMYLNLTSSIPCVLLIETARSRDGNLSIHRTFEIANNVG